jgi:hypothetical protein
MSARLRLRVLAFAVAVALPPLARAGTAESFDNGAASITFPRGTPVALGRTDPIWVLKEGGEAFIASASDEPQNPELKAMIRSCPASAQGENAQGRVTARCWEEGGDPVKEVSTAISAGDGGLMVVRIMAHAGRTYQAQYVRHGGFGPISADGAAFLASLHAAR